MRTQMAFFFRITHPNGIFFCREQLTNSRYAPIASRRLRRLEALSASLEKTVELDLTMIYLQDNKDPSGTNMGDEKELPRKENNAAAEEHDGKLINIVFRR